MYVIEQENLNQLEKPSSSPTSNAYFICQKVIKHILPNIETLINNNEVLAHIWNECNHKKENINTSISTTSQFNILDMPIEIDETNFNFTHEELLYSGVDVLSTKSIIDVNDEQHLQCTELEIEVSTTISPILEHGTQVHNEMDSDSNPLSNENISTTISNNIENTTDVPLNFTEPNF